MHKRYVIFLSVLVLMLTLISNGCSENAREYFEEIRIPLQTKNGEIIIREWRFLLGSGAEIYYYNDGSTTLLGHCSGGDDGYCPFQDGRYTLDENGKEITVCWLFGTTAEGKEIWHSQTFSID